MEPEVANQLTQHAGCSYLWVKRLESRIPEPVSPAEVPLHTASSVFLFSFSPPPTRSLPSRPPFAFPPSLLIAYTV
ncbi:hypothetical protein DPEC_G00045410 [Dallia pectoralis]|uniref:Uncharacterized protein n=1 Tax=Dallia pectoralis TaxID=75939 RepID=A0ACC2HAA9_DALPE|nr:hypothetical protein DPEC_G00045410 [Dallia pectoralis]